MPAPRGGRPPCRELDDVTGLLLGQPQQPVHPRPQARTRGSCDVSDLLPGLSDLSLQAVCARLELVYASPGVRHRRFQAPHGRVDLAAVVAARRGTERGLPASCVHAATSPDRRSRSACGGV